MVDCIGMENHTSRIQNGATVFARNAADYFSYLPEDIDKRQIKC